MPYLNHYRRINTCGDVSLVATLRLLMIDNRQYDYSVVLIEELGEGKAFCFFLGQGFSSMSPKYKDFCQFVMEDRIWNSWHLVLGWNMATLSLTKVQWDTIKLNKKASIEK